MARMNAFWIDVILFSLTTAAVLAYIGWIGDFQ